MSDFDRTEQEHIRTALRFLQSRCGDWTTLAKALPYEGKSLRSAMRGGNVSPTLAFRAARLAGVAMEDVVDGTYPPEPVCPHCGHSLDGAAH